MSGIRPSDCSKLAKTPKNYNYVTIFQHDVNVKFFWRCFVSFWLSSLVTGPSFMSISSLVLELWQFSFLRDWPEIWKLEIPPSEFFPISEDWGKLWIPNFARMSVIECYWMLQNCRVTAFTVFELLRENQLKVKAFQFCSSSLLIYFKHNNHIRDKKLVLGERKSRYDGNPING